MMIRKHYPWLVILLLTIPLAYGAFQDKPPRMPLPAHAHNDYYHERPLLDALEKRFRSIEVDVFSKGDSLFVAHDRNEIEPGRTLRELYLEPIRRLVNMASGLLYDTSSPLILLIDIKDRGIDTYKLMDAILQDYSDFLCTHSPKRLEKVERRVASEQGLPDRRGVPDRTRRHDGLPA